MNQPVLVLQNVAVRSGDALRFAGTDWVMNRDEHWAVIGRTGSGKSLFVNALCRRVPIAQGHIRYHFDHNGTGRSYVERGDIVLISAETQREFLTAYSGYHQARWQSMEGQDTPTVADLLTGRSIERSSPHDVTSLTTDEAVYAERRAEAVSVLGIAPLLERKILHLSNGEIRKVLLARALMQSPHLLILDDPFAGLDAASRDTLARVLSHICGNGRQRVILVASRASEIPDGITHVLGVDHCHVVVQGKKSAVLETPLAQKVLNPDPAPSPAPCPVPVTGWETPSTGSALIECRDVSIRYHGVTVLDHITWAMRYGERWAVRGPNGAGKSTLLSLILADNPQAYAVDLRLFGRRRGSGESIWDIKGHIGWFAPELAMFYQTRDTCQTVVCSGFFDSIGVFRDITKAQAERALAWMGVFGVDALAQQAFSTCSMGEQRLVLLARAFVKQPALVILDEPCQGLDAPRRSRIIEIVDSVCRQTPVSLLYVTHHRDELPRAITHVLELEQGRMKACGSRRDLDQART